MPSNKPNMALLRAMQKYSTRAWVYRPREGWLFAEMTPEERADFRTYEYGITIPKMRVRVPYGPPYTIGNELSRFANSFTYCTMKKAHPLVLSKFHLHQITDEEPMRYATYPVKPGSYETWLWADEIKSCQDLGCKVTVHRGFGWLEWGVPAEWKAPFTRPSRVQCKERTFIYALVDEVTQEVGYVGKSDDPEQRLVDHLRDTKNLAKWEWIQSLQAQGRSPKLLILEEVAVAAEFKRERYWISFYWERGHNLTNDICQYWWKHRSTDKSNGKR